MVRFILAFVVVFFVVFAIVAHYDEKQWDKFKAENGCKAMMTRDHQVAYQCDHGITIWR